MFGPFGGFELLVLAAIGLLVFGPRRLPEIGRTLGRAMLEFRRAANELRTSIEREINLEEMKETTRGIRDDLERSILAEPKAAAKELTQGLETGLAADLKKDLDAVTDEVRRETGDDSPKG